MEEGTPCVICRTEPGKYMCKACSMLVCAQCYDRKTGLCLLCKESSETE